MSEFQYVGFRAIDVPLSAKNLEYMRRQSSRAEVTRWMFSNEYHYGELRGNALEMLRRGYDIHLHYANFGIRKLLIRLPHGLPNPEAADPYLDEISFHKDKDAVGGTLDISPFHEPGELEELWDVGELLDPLIPLRAEILSGDLRPPLYLAHLAVCRDNEHDPESAVEAPVPAGLGQLTEAQVALAELYELSPALLTAAARDIPSAPSSTDMSTQFALWLKSQPAKIKDAWLTEIVANAESTVRGEILAEFRKETQSASAWPTIHRQLTIAQLNAMANDLQIEMEKKERAKVARTRAKELAKMAADPLPVLKMTEELVAEQSTSSYEKAGKLLADLREACVGSDNADLADIQARRLHGKHPTRRTLIGALRRAGFLSK